MPCHSLTCILAHRHVAPCRAAPPRRAVQCCAAPRHAVPWSQSLMHASYACERKLVINWIEASELEKETEQKEGAK